MSKVMYTPDIGQEERTRLKEDDLEFQVTDAGNGDRFTYHNSGKALYIEDLGRWAVWEGDRWRVTENGVYKLAEKTARKIYDEAKNCKTNKGRNILTGHAKASQSVQKIKAMLTSASSKMDCRLNAFDNDAEAMNCRNGIINLKTGELTPHDSSQMVMKKAEASYVQGSKSERWETFLEEIFEGNKELIEYLRLCVGYSMTGYVREHQMWILLGCGENGKGKFLETMQTILGDYACVTNFDTFLETSKSEARKLEAVGRLRGARLAAASETNSSRKWDEALLKKLTGGDPLVGARMYGGTWEFEPSHKLWFLANHLPGAKDASHGFWRRIIVIPFNVNFEKTKDEKLREKLLADRDGIFAWMVDCARDYLEKGLAGSDKIPAICREAVDQYREDNDQLSTFINERLTKEQGSRIKADEVYKLYQDWCVAKDVPFETRVSQVYFPKSMEERGITRKRDMKGQWYINIRKTQELPVTTPHNDNQEWIYEEYDLSEKSFRKSLISPF